MCLFLAKKKEKGEKKEKGKKFVLSEALADVNPYLKEGFHRFILDKNVTSQKRFNELLEEYGGA